MKKSRANRLSEAAAAEAAAVEAVEAVVEQIVEAPIVDIDTVIIEPVSIVEIPTINVEAPVSQAEVVKKKRTPMARVMIDGAKSALNGAVASVTNYVNGFMALPVGPRKGYDNYWSKEDGFTNPETIMKLTPQGLGKIMAICHHRAAMYIAEGGSTGSETLAILSAIRSYEEIAVGEARSLAKRKELADAELQAQAAIENLAKARGCSVDDARKAMSAFATPAVITQTVPAASVNADEKTVGESDAAEVEQGQLV